MGIANHYVGALIEHERRKQNISQFKLVNGIFNRQQLSNIEGNYSESDKLVLDILLQRLGKSPDKFEFILSTNDYNLMEARDMILDYIFENDLDIAEQILEKYILGIDDSNSVQQMFYYRTKAYILKHRQDHLEAFNHISKAIQFTMPEWDCSSLDDYLISTYEMENLLLYGELLIEIDIVKAKKHLEACLQYFDGHFEDTEERAKIYPKCIWLLSKLYDEAAYDDRMINLCENALELLKKEYYTMCLVPILEDIARRYERQGITEKADEYRIYCEVFNEIMSVYSSTRNPNKLFANPYQGEHHLDYETLRGERLNKGKTQQEISEGIFENKVSLSMIENHRKIAKKRNLERLFKALDIRKQRFNSLLATDSFHTLRYKDELDYNQSIQNIKGIEESLCNLEKVLDFNDIDNRRYIEANHKMYALKSGEIDAVTAIVDFKRILKETYPIDNDIIHRVPFRNEVFIINQIGICLSEMGDYGGASRFFKKILSTYDKSEVNKKYVTRSYMLLYANYVRYMEESGDIDDIYKAFNLSEVAIRDELRYRKTSMLAIYYAILGSSLIDAGCDERKEECKQYFLYAFLLNKFFNNKSDCLSISAYYSAIFNENII